MKKNIFLLLALAYCQNSFCQIELETVDSATIVYVDVLLEKSNMMRYAYPDSAKKLAEKALAYSENHSYLLGEAKSLNELGAAYNVLSNDAMSIRCFKAAAPIFEQLGNEFYAAKIQHNMAVLLIEDGQYGEAFDYVKKSYEYFLKNDHQLPLLNSYSGFGAIYIKTNQSVEKIMSVLNSAEKIARSLADTIRLVQVLNSKGIAHVNNDDNIPIAIDQFKEAVKLMKIKQPNDYFRGFSYMGLGEAYSKLDMFDKALLYNDTSLQLFQEANYTKGLQEVYESRKDVFAGLGLYEEGFQAYEMLKLYTDSLYNSDRSKQLNAVRTEYETEQKESEILSLSQQSAIQALEIQQKNQGIIVGLVVILFVLAVIYFIYKQHETKKQQSQTELEQRFLRSQLNPHFISNALVAVQSFMLKNDSESAALYLAKFSKLMREILENSRKEFIPVEEEVSMLRNYLDIHKFRLRSFDFSIDLDEDIDPEMDTIPPMFVQPFVENAVEHGIANLEGGKIELKFKKEEDYIFISVIDNGKGLSQLKNENHASLSSTIIKERMDLFNRSLKKKIQLVMGNLKNEEGKVSGTKIELKVPFG